MKTLRTIISILLLSCLLGCQQFQNDLLKSDRPEDSSSSIVSDSNLSEVTIPQTILKLGQSLEQYSPQVKIIAPKEGKTFDRANIQIELDATNFPLFQDEKLKLGNHLSAIIDNEALPPIYDLDKPISVKNLMPGTHTLRVFATTPWGESIKKKGAYAQTTFNVLTETNSNYPDPKLPLLTYNSPTGTYGAEPILLDFYLSNPDSVLNASDGDIKKPLVKATVNGTSFVVENWQPYYLTGFKPGENWVQLELIDELGNSIENTFNNTVRVFNYDPQQQDTMSKLVTGQIAAAEAQSIVEQNYYIQPVKIPEIIGLQKNAEPEIVIDAHDSESAVITEPLAEKNITKNDRQELETAKKIVIDPPNTEVKADSSDILPITVPNIISRTELELEADREDLQLTETSASKSATQTDLSIEQSNPEPVTIPTQLESAPEKIVIKEPEAKQPLVEIIIPQPESLEINESEIAILKGNGALRQRPEGTLHPLGAVSVIAVPKSEPNQDFSEIETETRFLWWKKLLIGLRQQIESLAKKLPNEV